MKNHYLFLLNLLIGLCFLVACTNDEPTPVAQAITTDVSLTPTLPVTTTATTEPIAAAVTPSVTLAATITPTATPTPLSPPTGRVYFMWDPLSRPDGFDSVYNLYMAIPGPGETPNDWKIETILTELVGIPALALSPDKTNLAFTALEDANNDGNVSLQGSAHYFDAPNIFVYSLGNQTLDRLTDDFPLTWDLTWSSDNERLAYQNGKDVYIATYPGLGERELLYTFPDYVQELAWSPDGHYLAIGIYNIGIYLFDDTTGALTNLDMTQRGSNLTWSPNGQWLVSSGFVAVGLNVINPTNLEIFTLIEEGNSLSTWSSDSHYLAFTQSFHTYLGVSDTSSLFLWDAEINDTRLIAETMAIPGVVWSPGSRSIAVGLSHKDHSELVQFDLENSVSTTLLIIPDGEEIIPLAWSPDGQWVLFYSKNSHESSLNLIHQTGGQVYELVDTTDTYTPYGVFWLP